jgi:preprotein translocase subunit SecY
MLNFITSKIKKGNKPNKKLLITLCLLFLFRLGNTIPLSGIDQDALKKSFLDIENNNSIIQILNMYSSGGSSTLTAFSLGIIPFINASIIIDLFTALLPFLEKLQSEEGESGRKRLAFYKKILTIILGSIQSYFLLFYLRNYFYDTSILSLLLTGLELVTGSLVVIWISNLIDLKGIGNGTSIIILTNIIINFFSKTSFSLASVKSDIFLEISFILIITLLICLSQTARVYIDVVSARQLSFIENIEKSLPSSTLNTFNLKENGLSIKLNQAGIFPIIIASNILPFLSYTTLGLVGQNKLISNVLYYLLIISFNYFYTIVFWDPEKISEQLRKASVSIVNVTPGQETTSYLENVVKSTSLLGGVLLCIILLLYEVFKQFTSGYLLNQLNISSLIIVVGVTFEIQKNIRVLYKTI